MKVKSLVFATKYIHWSILDIITKKYDASKQKENTETSEILPKHENRNIAVPHTLTHTHTHTHTHTQTTSVNNRHESIKTDGKKKKKKKKKKNPKVP